MVNMMCLIDSPKQATQDSFSLEPNDLVVIGTDGLFDNVTDKMILAELKPLQVQLVPKALFLYCLSLFP